MKTIFTLHEPVSKYLTECKLKTTAEHLCYSSVKVASICQDDVEQDLLYLANQASGFLDRLNLQEELSKVGA